MTPFTLRWTPQAREQYRELEAAAAAPKPDKRGQRVKPSKQAGLFKQVRKCLAYLQSNPRHPGLQTHEYHSLEHPWSTDDKVWEAYAQNRTPGAYRVFWCYGPERGELTIIAITPHP